MRIRSIRPEFWSSEDIARLSWDDRLIFIGLWSYVDDNGVGRDLDKLIAADLFPLDDDTHGALKKIAGALKHLEAGGQITRYIVDGKPYLHISAWDKHQKINRPSEGRYPLPTCGNAEPHGSLTEPSVTPLLILSAGEGEKGRRGEGEKGGSRRRAPETRLSDTWQPTDSHREYAASHDLNLSEQETLFRNYAKANDKRQRDWDATFSNWLIRALGFEKPKRPEQPVDRYLDQVPEAWR